MREIKSSRTSPSFPNLTKQIRAYYFWKYRERRQSFRKNLAISSEQKQIIIILCYPKKSDSQFEMRSSCHAPACVAELYILIYNLSKISVLVKAPEFWVATFLIMFANAFKAKVTLLSLILKYQWLKHLCLSWKLRENGRGKGQFDHLRTERSWRKEAEEREAK